MQVARCFSNSVQLQRLRAAPASLNISTRLSLCNSSDISVRPHYRATLTLQHRVLLTSSYPRSFAILEASHNPSLISADRSKETVLRRSFPSLSSTITRSIMGHSHGHHHHHDNAYLTSTNTSDPGVRITRIGLLVNLGMAIGKGVGGWYFNSQALVADGFHALTDMVSDIMTLATVSWSLKRPSSRFPTGYGKIESLGGLGVSGLLLVGGILMGLNAGNALYFQFFLDAAGDHVGHIGHSHSHSHSHIDLGPNINAAWLAGGSVIIKEYLYRASEYCFALSRLAFPNSSL